MMEARKSGLSTILIIDQEHGRTRSVNVKTAHVHRLKHYGIYLGLFVAALVAATIFLGYAVQEKNARLALLADRVSVLEGKEIAHKKDTVVSAKVYIENIEAKLKKINKYLLKRGIQGFTIDAVGGNKDAGDKLADHDSYELYESHLDKVLAGILSVPVGYPGSKMVTSGFGYRSNPFDFSGAELHPGLDFKGRKGDAVKSTANGTVVFAGWSQGYGNCIRIRHGNGYETLYGHLSKIRVKRGKKVEAGDLIGNVGSTGRSTGAHLHYEVRKNAKLVNPSGFLKLN